MLDQAFAALETFDWGDDPKLLQAIDQAVVETQGDAAAREQLERRLAAALEGDTSRDAKDYVCRQLMLIGTATSVPALAKLLANAETSHMARFALQQQPVPEAAAALRDALGSLSDDQLVGVIGSLGARRDVASVDTLARLLAGHEDKVSAEVSRAAAKALGSIGTVEAVEVLQKNSTSRVTAAAVTDALLSAAEALLSDGDRTAALAVYTELEATDGPQHIRLAALRGKLMCQGADS